MQRTQTTDVRIKQFMDKKMQQYPELEDVNRPRVAHQRGYLWDDVTSLFQGKKGQCMSRTIRHDSQTDIKPKSKHNRLTNMKRKYADFLMVDMWYEELPIVRKASRKARA